MECTESGQIDDFMQVAWRDILHAYDANSIRLQQYYLRCMEGLWNPLPDSELKRLLATNRDMFAHPEVLFERLCSISREETCGATLLMWGAERVVSDLACAMRDHARDETRHSGMYLIACDLVRPQAKGTRPREFSVRAEEEIAADAGTDDVAGLITSIHVAEVRNLMNLRLYSQLLSERDVPYRKRLQNLLRTISRDEMQHVLYTGQLVNRWLCSDARIHSHFEFLIGTYRSCWMADSDRIDRWFDQTRTTSTYT
jgi:hypothetical protein